MSLSAAVPSKPHVIQLREILDLPAAATLVEDFLKHAGDDLAVDASNVQRLGAPCLQVLLAAARTWKSEGDQLTLDRASSRFLEDLKLLGCEPGNFLDGAMVP